MKRVYGLSSQVPDYQAEVVDRLRLPFTMISDPDFQLQQALDLPTFAAPGHDRLYARLTLVTRDGAIEHVFYPIFPPNTHAQQVLDWVRANPSWLRSRHVAGHYRPIHESTFVDILEAANLWCQECRGHFWLVPAN